MDQLAIAVALLVLVSGCNAFGDTSTPAPAETVTAAPVPTAETTVSPRKTPSECVSPKPAAAPTLTPASRAEPVTLTDANGEINGTTLATRHGRTLSNYSFHLQAGSSGEVWSLPGAAAFTYEGLKLGVGAPWAYAVGGQLYTLRTDEGQFVFDERDYGPDSPTRERFLPILTGERWLTSQIGPYDYNVVETREYNGTEVRVLKDTTEGLFGVGANAGISAVVFVNSTVYVDEHGIVRYVRHAERVEPARETNFPNRTTVVTFTVDQVGTADLHRPAGFCVTNSDAIRNATPSSSAAPA